jgi:GrpB-like predicted nucleotidyltransferase (UPF0157 family)
MASNDEELGDVELFGEGTNEPVFVVDADPAWPARYEALRARLAGQLEPPFRIDHVGSTAVAGLAAKPIIDIQISVPDLADEAEYRAAIESIGVVLRAREPDHRFFRTPKGTERRLHVHVCQSGSDWERRHLLFRDYLRAHPELAAEYEQLKRRLADELRDDRIAYTDAKDDFVAETVRRAEHWAAETGWHT